MDRKNIKQFGGDPENIALLGHSAGAQIAALMGTNASFMKSVAPGFKMSFLKCIGSYDTEGYDVEDIITHPANERQKATYMNAFGSQTQDWIKASAINFISKSTPKFQLTLRGSQRRRNITKTFIQALKAKGVGVAIIHARGLSHQEVNQVIGSPSDTVMSPRIKSFLASCF